MTPPAWSAHARGPHDAERQAVPSTFTGARRLGSCSKANGCTGGGESGGTGEAGPGRVRAARQRLRDAGGSGKGFY